MALNFGILDPDAPAKLAGSVYAGQQQRQQNELAQQQQRQQNELAQQQAAARQQELGMRQQEFGLRQQEFAQSAEERQAKLQRAQGNQKLLANLSSLMEKNGQRLDRPTLGSMLQMGLQTNQDALVQVATKGLQALDEQEQFQSEMEQFKPAPTPSATNILAPAAFTKPTTASASGYSRPQIENMLTNPNARVREMGSKLLGAMPKEASVPADVATMQALGIPATSEGYTYFQALKAKDSKPTDLQSNYEYAKGQGFKGNIFDYEKTLKEAGRAPGTSVTMISERAEQGARGKMLVDQYGDIAKAAGLAVKTLPSIDANLSALNKGFDTGFGKETVAAGASVLAALGVKDAEKFATDTQKFQSNAISAVLQKQLEQKGPQTESDARRIEQIGAQLGKTKQANEFILSMAGEQLRRDIDQRNFYDRWYKTNKTYDGAEDAWFNSEGGKSLFDRPGLKKYVGGPSASSQIPSNAPIVSPAAKTIVNPKFPGFSIGKP